MAECFDIHGTKTESETRGSTETGRGKNLKGRDNTSMSIQIALHSQVARARVQVGI